MRLSTSIGFVLLGCTLLSPLPLFAVEHYDQTGPPLDQQYPGPNGLAKFRKIVSGEFDPNLRRDAAFLDDHTLISLRSAGIFDSRVTVATNVNDMAVLSSPILGKDLLVTVGTDGLVLHQHITSAPYWSHTVLGDGASIFGGAPFVACGDVNADGYPDIVAVLPNKRDFAVKLGGVDPLVFAPSTTWVCPTQTINGFGTMNWTNANGAGTSEVWMCSDLGWAVRDAVTGLWLKVSSYTLGALFAEVIARPGSTDRLMVRTVFGGTDRLSIHDVTRSEGSYNLGPLGIVAMAAADVALIKLDGNGNPILDADGHPIIDTDGFVDLILTTNTTKNVSIFRGQSGLVTFDLSASTDFPFGATNRLASWNQAGFTVGDFDNDGYKDVFAPGQGAVNPGPLGAWGCFTDVRPKTDWTKDVCAISAAVFVPSEHPEDLSHFPDQVQLTFDGPQNTRLVAGNGQIAEILIDLYHSPGLGQHPDPTPLDGHVDIPAGPHDSVTWSFPLPAGYNLHTSTDFFALVAYQRIAVGNTTIALKPALEGFITPDPTTPTVAQSVDTSKVIPIHRIHDEPDLTGSWDEGPTVPPVPDETEPQEVPGGGG